MMIAAEAAQQHVQPGIVGDAGDAEEGRVAQGGGVAHRVRRADDARALVCGDCGWWWIG